jgi:pilus assembly protein CpaF
MSYVDFPALRPIRHLLLDPNVSEIMINGVGRLFVERAGKMEPLRSVFQSQGQVEAAVEALIGMTGRAVTQLTPFVDFRLPDGSRVNIAVRPIAIDGPIITIRRQSVGLKRLEDLVERGALTPRMGAFLCACVMARLNIVFSGGTGSGKTTLLGLLSRYLREDERIVVIEDTAELVLTQPNVVRLECRPPNIEGAGAVKLGDLLKNSLRMRPTRIIVGEVRGEEAFDLLSAMSSGHDGGFAVLHASSPLDAVSRLVMMILARGLSFPLWAIQQQIASAIDVIVQHAQMPDGTRRVMNITAVQEARDDTIVLEDVFAFDSRTGHFTTGTVEPVWLGRVRRAAPDLVRGLFEERPMRSTSARRSKPDAGELTQRTMTSKPLRRQ